MNDVADQEQTDHLVFEYELEAPPQKVWRINPAIYSHPAEKGDGA